MDVRDTINQMVILDVLRQDGMSRRLAPMDPPQFCGGCGRWAVPVSNDRGEPRIRYYTDATRALGDYSPMNVAFHDCWPAGRP